MPEIIVPCPNCQTSLLVDEQNAGHDVLCPGCHVRLTLPHELTGAVLPVMKGHEETDLSKKNHPLYRTGHLAAMPVEPDPAAGPPPPRAAHLPEHRGLTPEEEMRRLAALTTEPASYDLHNVDTKGRTAFPCPGCHRPVWIARQDWGQTLTCEGCAQEIVAPDPDRGIPARLTQLEAAPAPRRKTVLPGRRQVEDLTAGEQPAAGRPKRQGGQLPPARELPPEPMALAVDRARTRAPGIEPIPARGDVDMSAAVRKGPPAGKQAAAPSREQTAATAGFEDHTDRGTGPAEPPALKVHHRINPERTPTFTPKHEPDLSIEATSEWGGVEPQENSIAFRRILTVAVITLLVGAIAITAYLLRSTFAPPDLSADNGSEPESPIQSVERATAAMDRFFSATTVEEKAREVRHPEITLPRMKAWYARNALTQHKADYNGEWREQDNYAGKGINFIFTTIKLDSLKNCDIFLEVPKDGGTPKIDWEHFTGWSETTWLDFLKSTSLQPGDFRVTVTPTDYYNGHFSDRSRYLAFTVKDRDNTGSCTAYCEAGTNLGNLLLKSIREARKLNTAESVDAVTGEGVARVILRLRYLPEGQKFNQATVDALVWDDWLEP